MKNSKRRQEDKAVETYFQTHLLNTKMKLLCERLQKEIAQEDYVKNSFPMWKTILCWAARLTIGGGTV